MTRNGFWAPPPPATIAPPTIADLQFQGVAGVTCCNPVCLRPTPIAFAAIGLAPETPFPAIAGARRFVYAARGSRSAAAGPKAAYEPTLHLDHPMGAGRYASRCERAEVLSLE